jgi:hypothetical protein
MRSFITKCYYGDQIKEDEMGGGCSTHGRKKAYNILIGKLEGKRPLVRPRHR